MADDEIKSHKGDTIVLKQFTNAGKDQGISDIFAHSTLDALLEEHTFRIKLLDSIFNSEIQKDIPYSTYLLNSYDRNGNILDSNNASYNKNNYIITATHPLGTKGEFYIKAFVEIPPHLILRQMLYALIVSFLMTVIIFYCLYYQLVVIRRTRKQLQQHVHTFILPSTI